jgi:hypothetical protein
MDDGQGALEEELVRLKSILDLNDELRVVWKPVEKSALAGEVNGWAILLYDTDLDSASARIPYVSPQCRS